MARRNKVPETVSHETRQAKALQKRRETEEIQRRAAEHPSMSAASKLQRAAWDEEKERARREAMFPSKAAWDRMTWEERDAIARAAQQGMEAGATYAMPGMIIRNPAHLGEGMVAKAESMLKGRTWSDLSRVERLAIKRATGLEQIEGGLPGWAKESMTDPALKPRMLERAREWQAGDTTTGRRLGAYKDITEGGRDYMASLDEGQWTDVWMRKAREGEMGFFNPLEETMFLTERADLAGKAPTMVHEGEHVSQSFTQFAKDAKVPYGYRPTEIEARIAEHRAGLSPEQRANSLLEESQNNWGQKWYHEELKEEQQKLLRQDAKGGNTRADAKGGDAPGTSVETPPPGPAPAQPQGGPRIVVNPSTFKNEKDALCVAFNEAFRVVMEDLEFEPQSEPTDEQRRFFSDTAYADDELQLRRTILARICTFDTSVEDPTDEQLQEAVEFLETVQEVGAPQNDWERNAVQRLRDMVAKVLEDGEGNTSAPPPLPQGGSVQADEGGGAVQQDDEEERRRQEAAEAARAEEEAQAQEDAEQRSQAQEDAKRKAPAQQSGQTGQVTVENPLAGSEPTGRLARDLERIARSSKSDRDTFMSENMQESARYALTGRNIVDTSTALTLARAQPLAEWTKDYDARREAVEQRQADNHYTSGYVQAHDSAVSARKSAATDRKIERNRLKDQEEEERRRNRGLGA